MSMIQVADAGVGIVGKVGSGGGSGKGKVHKMLICVNTKY